MTEIERLQKTFRDLHGCDSIHSMSVPVHETFQGQRAWEGTVEVFFLPDHPRAEEGYAWSYKAANGETRYVAILGIPPLNTPIDAVRAYITAQAKKQIK
jgi:hypothetical protein